MKKLLVFLTLCCLLLAGEALAMGKTTVLEETVKNGQVPSVDGLNNAALQSNINGILKSKAAGLAKQAGGNAVVSYDVVLNRDSLFSVIMKAVGNKTLYAGINIDNTSGKEVEAGDFFYQKEDFKKLVGDTPFILAEDGLLLEEGANGPFVKKVPYTSLLKDFNLANSDRLFATYRLTAEAQDKTLRLARGEVVALYLHSNPTTGYDWYVVNGDQYPGFVNLGRSFVMPNTTRGMTGAPGTTILVFSFNQAGSYKLRIDYKRNWLQDYSKTNTYNFSVK